MLWIGHDWIGYLSRWFMPLLRIAGANVRVERVLGFISKRFSLVSRSHTTNM